MPSWACARPSTPGPTGCGPPATASSPPTSSPARPRRRIEAGFELEKRIGWDTIVGRAAEAAAEVPPDAVLAGISMGAGVVGGLWAQRPATRGILLLHGVCEVPADARRGLPVQVHLADPDPYESEEWVGVWQAGATAAGLAAELFRYPGAGHYFTDAALPGYDPAAAGLTFERALGFLDAL